MEIDDIEWVNSRLKQLSLIDEKWLTVVCVSQLYQQRMDQAYNKRMNPRNLEIGQLVWNHILPH